MEQELQTKEKKNYKVDLPEHTAIGADTYPSKEIDLFELSYKIYKTILANIKLIAFCIMLTLLTGTAYYPFLPSYYESFFVVKTEKLPDHYYIDLLIPLQNQLMNGDYAALERLSGIRPQQAQYIQQLDIEEGSKEGDNLFKVVLKVSQPVQLPALSDALIRYFNSSHYVVSKKSEERAKLEQLLADIDTELEKMLRTQNKLNEMLLDGRSAVVSAEPNAIFIDSYAGLSRQILALKERKYNTKEYLKFFDEAQIAQDFHPFGRSQKVGIYKYVGGLLFFAVFFSLAVLTIKVIIQAFQKREKEADYSVL